ncbi:MAG: PASTA domain-containing protein [Steroidobacteraceae bacterium]
MRRILRLAMLGLILMLVALFSALAAMRFAIHGREERVPALIGLSQGQAESRVFDSGFQLEVADRFYSPTVPSGSILSQVPQPGERVRRGWRVRVAISLGPPHVTVPDVIGQSGRAGEINVRRRGLDVATIAVAHLPGLPPDQVVAESPQPASSGLVSPNVSLLITAPNDADAGAQSYVMPDLTGRRVVEAAAMIQQAGLQLGSLDQTSPFVPPPAASALSAKSSANPPASAPGNKLDAAKIPLPQAFYAPGATIRRQSPAPGQKITASSMVLVSVTP